MAESYSVEAILSARDTNFTSTMQSAQDAMRNMGKSSSGFGNTMKGVVSGLGVFKIASAAIGAVTGSIDNAISRVDTLANSARVFENMGFSASDTESMMESLNDSITGLPTSLNDAVSGVQLLASAMGDIGKSQEVFSAMNNAIIGFGGTAGMVDNAIIQLSQAFSNGKIDAQTWNSMINSGLGPSLNALAKEMGYTTGEFKSNLSDGTISVEEFQDALISLDKDGGGGLKSLQQIAQDSTKGISTSLANARTSITRGVANIITAIDTGLSNAGLGSISDIINGIGKAAERMLTGLAGGIEKLGAFIAPLVEGFQSILSPIDTATEAINAFSGATDELAEQVVDVSELSEKWGTLTLDEKQASIETLGQEELAELLELLGVDFESIPDEYTKDAFLNTHGKDALEEILWVTGKWHDLTLEEKRAVLEAQIENKPLEEAIENMGLWEDASFVSKFAEINMNDNDSGQQVLDLINYYRELDGQEPIELEVDVQTKPAEKAINKFAGDYKKFSKSIGKFTKGIGKVVEKTGELFEPAFDFLGDLSKSSLKMLGKYVDATGQLFEGDWAGAWVTFKDATKEGLTDVVSSLKTNVPKMWDNLKGMARGLWQAFKDIDWGLVLSEINSFFGGIADQITSIDWYAVGVAVSGTVADLGIAIKDYLDENFGDGKLGDLIMKAISEMFDPTSDLNVDAGKFTNAVMETLDGIADGISQALGGFNITESSAIWRGKLIKFFSGLKNTWEELASVDWDESLEMGTVIEDIKAAVSKGFEDIEFDPITFEWPEFNWGDWQPYVDQLKEEVDTVISAIKEIFASITLNDIMPSIEFQIPFGDLLKFDWATGEWHVVDVNVEINPELSRYEDVQEFIDSKIEALGGEGEQVIATPRLVIDILKGEGMPDDEIQNVIDRMFNGKEYDANTIVVPDLEVKEEKESISQKVSNFFAGLKPVTASAQVEVTPDVSVAGGSGKSGGLTGAVGGGLSGTFSALQAEVTAQMTAISAAVSTSMTTVSTDMQTGMTNAQTAVQSAMVSIVSTITAGMLSMVVAGRLGTTMFNIAFRAGLNQAVVTAQSIVNSIINVFNGLASNMFTAGIQAGSGFQRGLSSQAGAIERTASNIATSVSSTIQAALRISSPSKVTTYLGEMVGAGLIAGMDGMISGVESSANRLSLATLPTTDLGSARYSGSVSGQSTSSKLDEVIDAINRGQVIMMDSGALVGETSRQMDVALGQQGSLGGRHKL